MPTIEIDGQKVEAEQGKMIIQVADEMGVYIPRFCYHKKLSVAANCRMCLVQVGEGKKAMPACATPIMDGMQVQTKSDIAVKAQKAVMEFLLINHPLDCPICDQGGQCELQDLAMGYGNDSSRYDEGKRVVKDKDIGPLVATELTRCIQCTRCIRFGEEIAGTPELGMHNRGEHASIGTAVGNMLKSEIVGNVIDVCPVGALTAKPSRYTARAWEQQQHPSIAPHDCLGSNLNVFVRRNEVIKASPRENESVNEVWIADRDRFSYEGLHSADRLTKPMIKQHGKWQETDWLTALEFTLEGLQQVLNTAGAEQVAGIISPSATTEEHYLLQKILRGVGSNNIDHRIHQMDFRDDTARPLMPSLGLPIADVEHLNALLLVGSNAQKEQPLLQVRIRKMVNNGGKLFAVYPHAGCQSLPYDSAILAADMAQELAGIAKALGAKDECLKAVESTAEQKHMAEQLKSAEKAAIVLGQLASNHDDAAMLHHLANLIAEQSGASIGELTVGANSAGAWLAGAVPHRHSAGESKVTAGMSAYDAFAKQLKAYVLFGIEPELDCANPAQAVKALKQAEFVVAMTSYNAGAIAEQADVLLPITPFTETSGTYVNCQGDWQSFTAVCKPLAHVRPGWKVLRVLGNMLKVENLEYTSSQEVRDELKTAVDAANALTPTAWQSSAELKQRKGLQRVAPWFTNKVDSLVRRATALQQTETATAQIIIHPALAEKLGLRDGAMATARQGGAKVMLPVKLSDKLAETTVFITSGFVETASLGAPAGEIEVTA
tara:strand:- start:42044 stop:44371 length:2328 start_codon:yes stop_codon:yes gene_type:complete